MAVVINTKRTKSEAQAAKAKPVVVSGADNSEQITKSMKEIYDLIEKVGITSKELHETAHLCACRIVMHAIKYHDVSPALRLCNAIGKMARVNALKQWFLDFGPMTWNDEAKAFRYDKLRGPKMKASTAKAEEALKFAKQLRSVTFWDYKKEVEFKPFNLEAVLRSAIKKAEAVLSDDENKNNPLNVIDPAKLHALKLLLAQPAANNLAA